jgi:hypothetical protein
MIRLAFGEEGTGNDGCLNSMLGSSEQTEKGKTGGEQSQEHANHFL